MITDDTQIIEQLVFAGPIAVWQAVLLWLLLLAACAWLLRRERAALGRVWATVFWIARGVALGFILWMLLGPTREVQHRTTIPQTVALVVDGSDSMEVVDPLPAQELLRWSASVNSAEQSPAALLSCDRAIVAVEMMRSQCASAAEAVARHAGVADVEHHLASADQAARRAGDHLGRAAQQLRPYDGTLASRVGRIAQVIDSAVTRDLTHVSRALASNDVAQAQDLLSPGGGLQAALTRAARQLQQATLELTERLAEHPSPDSDFIGTQKQSRKQMVAGTLKRLENEHLARLSDVVRIKRMRVGTQVTPVASGRAWEQTLAQPPPAADAQDGTITTIGPTTNLTAALEQLSREAASEAIRAAIVFSDGGHNAPHAVEPAQAAAGLVDMAVHVVPIGSNKPLRDVLLHRFSAPTAVIVNDSVVVEAIVSAFQCAGESTEIVLRRDGKVVEERRAEFSSERMDQRLRFSVPADELGRYEFELVVEPIPDEASDDNNVAVVQVNVVRDSTRVLLADRLARWEYRYLEQLFRRDERVTFDKYLTAPEVTATGALAATQALPSNVEAWGRYDVVILGDLAREQLDERCQQALAEYVRVRGGNLVIIAGRDHMPHDFANQPLVDLLPVQRGRVASSDDGYLLQLTSEGVSNNAVMIADAADATRRLWAQQYRNKPLYFLSDFCRPKPAAQTLIAAVPKDRLSVTTDLEQSSVERAFLCWHRAGAGRVVYLSAPATYQLRYRRGDRLHHKFWGQLLRWVTAADRATGTAMVRLKCDKTRYEWGDPATVTVRLADEHGNPLRDVAVGAVAKPQDSPAIEIDLSADPRVPGRYRGEFAKLPPGAYRVEPTGEKVAQLLARSKQPDAATALINVFASENIELLDTTGNRPLLEQLAEITGGQVVPPTAIDELLALTTLSPEVSEHTNLAPLWNRWSYLWIVAGCLCGEWFVRKRLGLV